MFDWFTDLFSSGSDIADVADYGSSYGSFGDAAVDWGTSGGAMDFGGAAYDFGSGGEWFDLASDGMDWGSLAQSGMDAVGNYGGDGGWFDLGDGGAAASDGGFNLADGMQSALKIAGPAMSIGSGLVGMSRQQQLRRQAPGMDPWGASGGRAGADAQLQQLMRDPSQVAASDPSYKLRIQGAQRANAQYGQDSGAMSVAGANASTDWYNQRLQQLGGLAGAPGNAAAPMQGYQASNDLLGKSLGSMGYGVTSATGGGADFSPAQLEYLKTLGKA